MGILRRNKVAIVASTDTYPKGYHEGDTGGLDAIETDLATSNIKSGENIFGKSGSANVVDTTTGDAVAGDIRTTKKAWVDGSEVIGNIAEVAIAAGSEAVPAGIHTSTNLSTIDGDLATGNIKSGETIFGIAGHTNVRDSSDADAALSDVKNAKTFYASGGAKKTGNLATVALVAGSTAYPTGYHAGEANLMAVDEHLVAGNIADGVTIFGVTGTLPAGLSFATYEYHIDLASAANYVPPGKTFFRWGAQAKGSADVNFEIYNGDGSYWLEWETTHEYTSMKLQDSGQHCRLINDNGSVPRWIQLNGMTASAMTSYEYNTNLAGAATYTPPAMTFYKWWGAVEDNININCEIYNDEDGAWSYWQFTSPLDGMVVQNSEQYTRIINDSGGAKAIEIFGGTP